jgi:ATP-binding cassette subfamily B protein
MGEAGLLGELVVPIVLHAAHYAVLLIAWWVLGRGALSGHMDTGWLTAWGLLLLTAVPLHLFAVRAQGRFTVGAGALLKKRLLYGTLRLNTEEIRHQGVGHWLGRVIESNAIESLALNGGFQALVAIIELGLATWVLGAGSAGYRFVLMLTGYVALALIIVWRYFRRSSEWTKMRMTMAGDLIERMIGHRTRLAQERRERWHDGEDQVIERYLTRSLKLDRADLWQSLVPRGWLAFGLCGLAVGFVTGSATPATLAVAIGGLLWDFVDCSILFRACHRCSARQSRGQKSRMSSKRPRGLNLIFADFAARRASAVYPATPLDCYEAHDLTFDTANAQGRYCKIAHCRFDG